MTEAEWMACEDPLQMLECLRGKASDRKLRLFACACCRSIWDSLTYERSRQVVEIAERYADGNVTEAELQTAYSKAREAVARLTARISGRKLVNRDGPTIEERRLYFASETAHAHKPFLLGRLRWVSRDEVLTSKSPGFLREIFGNPFCQMKPDPSWLAWNNETVVKLAQGIYEERAFDRMPILADALEDAGCHDENILNHCREQEKVHVRGCWVLDLLLQKE